MSSACYFVPDLAFIRWLGPQMEPDVCADSGEIRLKSLFICGAISDQALIAKAAGRLVLVAPSKTSFTLER